MSSTPRTAAFPHRAGSAAAEREQLHPGRRALSGRAVRAEPPKIARLEGHYIARLVGQGLCVAGVVTIEVCDAPARVEYAVWSGFGSTPAAAAFLDVLDIAAQDGPPA
ncbi:hypothetical protein AB0O22_19125 [Streptomyces sp. NPDC091204]|uniref:hypothetical protein n=1 Tax=Streptomyces sp. NPDC091204 TaxID=3155299 RepID=UPI003426068B